MKYHAIKTMKANENGQILRGLPTPIFVKIQYFSLHYVFFPHNKAYDCRTHSLGKLLDFYIQPLNICSHFRLSTNVS
jgi:hypothetical protein